MDAGSDNLARFIQDVCPDSHLRVEKDLGDGFVLLRSDEAERRQAAHDIRSTEDIIIELLRNSRDAGASRIFLATTTQGSARKITVIDDGVGIPPALNELIFEPRVTSKLDSVHMDKWGIHGRGMALYSVTVNSECAKVQASDKGKGASIYVETDVTKLKEKADQSTFPTIVTDGKRAVVRGPRNINRTAVEFAMEHRDSLEVYLGTPSEIAATIYWLGIRSVPASMRLQQVDMDDLPLAARPARCLDEQQLADQCAALGLAMSERSARRILDGQIAPRSSLKELVEAQLQLSPEVPKDPNEGRNDRLHAAREPKKAKGKAQQLDHVAVSAMREVVESSYRDIAESYYLDPDVRIDLRIVNNSLRISIPLIDAE